MSVSIYYTARRDFPLSVAEWVAIDTAQARYPVEALMEACGVSESDFNGEAFCVYSDAADTELGVVFEGATKLPLCSEDAFWAAVQYWCRLLSEIRRAVPDAQWEVYVDDHNIPWAEGMQVFDPSA